MSATVYCQKCRASLNEFAGETPPNLTPCPACGSTDRGVTIFPPTVEAKASIPTPQVIATSGIPSAEEFGTPGIHHERTIKDPLGLTDSIETAVEKDEALPIIPLTEKDLVGLVPQARRIEWLLPSEAGGSYTLQVFDEGEALIGMTEQNDPGDAIAALLDELYPKTD